MLEPLLLEAVPGCAALVDGAGRVCQVNQAWAEAAEGNPFLAGAGPGCDYRERCQGLGKASDGHVSLVAIGILSALSGRIRRLKLEYPLIRDGVTRWFAMTTSTGPEGHEAGTVIAHQDITERMERELTLKRREQLFKATTENALDLIAVLNKDGQILYASPSYGKTLGRQPLASQLVKLQDLVCEEDRAGFLEQLRVGFRLGVSPLFEARVSHRDGSIRHLEARAVAVENPGGNRESILLTCRDISGRKEAEADKTRMEIELRHSQKMEAIGQLAAGIAHEINTPCQYLNDNMGFLADTFASLTEVLSLLQARLGQPEPDLAGLRAKLEEQDVAYLLEEAPRAIAQSRDGLARIGTIVKAMKVFGHPGGEGMAAVNLNDALSNTLIVAQSEWKYVAEVATELDPELPVIQGSPGELNQVFLNLIVNAAHAIGEQGGTGKGRITVTTRRLDQAVEVRIQDTGAGIPESIRDRVFLPFFTTKAVGKGTGQGLAIAHSVIAKHGGSIEFESVVGQGTAFIIRLPLA